MSADVKFLIGADSSGAQAAVAAFEAKTVSAMAVAEKHAEDAQKVFAQSLRLYLGVTDGQVNEWLAELGTHA